MERPVATNGPRANGVVKKREKGWLAKKGVSIHQLHRALEVTYKTAWFMTHRIREAIRDGDLAPMTATAASWKWTRRS